MKRFLLFFTIILASFSLLAANAEAKRFGGGGSFGKQRSFSQQQMQRSPAAAPAPAQPGAQPQPAGNRWLGPLAGLALGAGLGAMFAGGGLGGAMGNILMMMLAAGLVMFLISMFRRSRQQTSTQFAGAGAPYAAPQPVQQPLAGGSTMPTHTPVNNNIPADFPLESFLRSAKTTFIRLQAANDRKDLDDIREYTTPEMFAEISMQIRERDNTSQKTDVLAIDAGLLEVANEDDYAIASVRFTGQLSENNRAPESIDEIWIVQKNLHDDKSVWLLTGIQQATLH